MVMLAAVALLMAGIKCSPVGADQTLLASGQNPFSANVKVSWTPEDMVVFSDGIPNHPHGDFPNASNPNPILKQNYRFVIPRHPRYSKEITPTPFGPIGVAINGIPFYNQYNGNGQDAVKLETFDSCCGHPDSPGPLPLPQVPGLYPFPVQRLAGPALPAHWLCL